MLIREEKEKDYTKIRDLVETAFASAEHTDGNEHLLVDQLRKSDSFVKELALVAEENGELLAHIMFTKVAVGEKVGLALAPLSVLPKAQSKGIGTALVKRAHEIASSLGYEFSVVLGSETYYPRFGYKVASEFGVLAPFEVPKENFMISFLGEEVFELKGTVEYVKEIFEA